MAYRIEFTVEALGHFIDLDAHQRARLRDEIVEQLSHEPATETRRRKRMWPNSLAVYRLRVGDLRVYYDLIEGPAGAACVVVKAIGIKIHERLLIGGEEIDLS